MEILKNNFEFDKYNGYECQRYDYSILTEREAKGMSWEVYCQYRMDIEGFEHRSNPTDPKEWKRNIESGADSVVYVGERTFGVEFKFNQAPVYPSYVERDYIPRFVDTEAKGTHLDRRIVVTSDKHWFSLSCFALFEKHGIMLMDIDEYILFLHQQHEYCVEYNRLQCYYSDNNSNVVDTNRVTSVNLNCYVNGLMLRSFGNLTDSCVSNVTSLDVFRRQPAIKSRYKHVRLSSYGRFRT
jgi:hypothetical protein